MSMKKKFSLNNKIYFQNIIKILKKGNQTYLLKDVRVILTLNFPQIDQNQERADQNRGTIKQNLEKEHKGKFGAIISKILT